MAEKVRLIDTSNSILTQFNYKFAQGNWAIQGLKKEDIKPELYSDDWFIDETEGQYGYIYRYPDPINYPNAKSVLSVYDDIIINNKKFEHLCTALPSNDNFRHVKFKKYNGWYSGTYKFVTDTDTFLCSIPSVADDGMTTNVICNGLENQTWRIESYS